MRLQDSGFKDIHELLQYTSGLWPERITPFGDIVLADIDGVVVIPREAEEKVIALSLEKASAEDTVRDELLKGAFLGDVFKKYGVL